LKQEYEKIGLQVFHAFKESFFSEMESFLIRRKSGDEDYFAPAADNETANIFG